MRTMKSGSIPEKLTIIVRKPTKVYFRWNDVEGGDIESEVHPCFISDATNKKTIETGMTWGRSREYNSETRQYEKVIEPRILEVDNVPFTNIRIITLEIRDQGGRAYKVCADIGDMKNLYFDMREDVLLDCMFNSGINKGGNITDKFIFARVGSDMKIIRVGSFLHSKMIESTEMNKTKPISDLEIGGLYKNKSGQEVVYMGKLWAREPIIEEYREHGSGSNAWGKHYYRLKEYGKPSQFHVFLRPTIDWKSVDEHNIKWFADENDFQVQRKYLKVGDPLGYPIATKSHSYKEKIRKVEIPLDFMEKSIEWERKNGVEYSGAKTREKEMRRTATISSLTLEKPE